MEMNVVAESWTGKLSNAHLSDIAWSYSRPGDTETHENICQLDASINEIPSVVVQVKSTAIEREIITTMRDHVIWARTSRVDDVTKFTVPRFFKNDYPLYYDIQFKMQKAKNAGVTQDEFRLMLPLVHETQYMARFSMRSLHKLYHEYERLSATCIANDVAMMFKEASEVTWDILDEMGIVHNDCKEYDLLPTPSSFVHGRVLRANSIISCQLRVPFSLRTHIVRHRNLNILDELRKLCIFGSMATLNLHTEIEMEISGTYSDWDYVLSKRSCWMAHQGLWAPLVKLVSSTLNCPITLPCANGSCPYEVDAKLRLTDVDPGSPCPEYAELYDIKLTRSQLNDMTKTVVSEARSSFWTNKIRKLEAK
jgi:hypothetical protein